MKTAVVITYNQGAKTVVVITYNHVITYNQVLYIDYIGPARLRLNLSEVAPVLKRV